MKFAIALDKWPADVSAMALRCRGIGFEGVELPAPDSLDEAAVAAARSAIEAQDVALVCFATPVLFEANQRMNVAQGEHLRRVIEMARKFACPRVYLRDIDARGRLSRTAAVNQLAPWLEPLGDWALSHDIMLVVENGPTFRVAADMWALLQRLSHPAIGCCWAQRNSEKAGESPSVAVPTLNSRIQHVRFAGVDPRISAADVSLRLAVQRLRGIGYEYYVSVNATLAALQTEEGTRTLTAVYEKLTNWASPPQSTSSHSGVAKKKP